LALLCCCPYRNATATLPAVSKHIKVLEGAGLIQRGRRAQLRPCVLDPDVLEVALSWTAACHATLGRAS
jgi:DNA-binding transcriptional ArsR family regulator